MSTIQEPDAVAMGWGARAASHARMTDAFSMTVAALRRIAYHLQDGVMPDETVRAQLADDAIWVLSAMFILDNEQPEGWLNRTVLKQRNRTWDPHEIRSINGHHLLITLQDPW